MRRATGLYAICRAVEGVSAVSVAGNGLQHRLIGAALYSSGCSSSSDSSTKANGFFSKYTKVAAHGLAGALLFSAAASEVYAKEPLPPQLRPKEVILYQYEACPFCNKVKAFLDYYDIPYKVVEVNPISKKEIKWSDDYKKVPILMVDGEPMIDSSVIIDKLTKKIRLDSAKEDEEEKKWPIRFGQTKTKKIQPDSAKEDEEEKKWRGWVDSHLVHLLSPNIYRNTSEALESFEYITSHGNFSYTERLTAKYAGAVAMYFVSKSLKRKYDITDERAALYEAAETWVNALNGRDFLGGSKPNLADLAVYGVLRPIRYLKAGKDMVEHTRIGDWYSRMENVVGVSSRIQE